MHLNYGDKKFFERGRLVNADDPKHGISILYCNPYPEEEDLYVFADLTVCLDDGWIDWKKVGEFSGVQGQHDPAWDDPAQKALDAVEYYGPEEFGATSSMPFANWQRMTRSQIMEIIEWRLIDWSGVSFDER